MLDTERCWQALCERDASFDGHFVFAVHSTGIFCRPSCPARRPRRESVTFHINADAALAAGFRPCRRCAPQGRSPAEQLDELVVAACRLLDEAPQTPTLDQLAARIGLSASHLAHAFKARTGTTPHAWANARRRERLDERLPSADSVLAAALDAGFSGTRGVYQAPAALSPAQRSLYSLAAIARGVWAQLVRWQTLYSQRQQLAALSDELLKDIGHSRADIEAEVSRPFWDDPLKRR